MNTDHRQSARPGEINPALVSAPATSADRGRALVLYDGRCPLCLKSVAILRRLDWFHRLGYHDARDPTRLLADAHLIASGRLLEEMHLLLPDRLHLLHGFSAFRWMAWRLPLLWLVAPFLYLPGMGTWGQGAYLWVARNRFRLVPCHGGVCTMPRDGPNASAHRARNQEAGLP
jgi:predicted DCC family thiol-disulfide oxidoreductase YuxK